MSMEYKNPQILLGDFYSAQTAGLEPVTSRVTGGCSNQLSYVCVHIAHGDCITISADCKVSTGGHDPPTLAL